MEKIIKDYRKLTEDIIGWLEEYRRSSKTNGFIVGLSGGVDSSVTVRLCQKTGSNILGLIMPCNSNSEDSRFAKLLINKFNVPYLVIDLSDIYNQILKTFEGKIKKVDSFKIASANLKARIRMCCLYFFANINNYLVVGTDNKSESVLGYFTKYGDGAVDILPISELFKSQVYKLAQELSIPEEIIKRPPSAGLWADQTDEKELGVSYDEIEEIIKNLDNYTGPNKKIIEMIKRNAHKSKLPPSFKDIRYENSF